jgi:hypothetical protein
MPKRGRMSDEQREAVSQFYGGQRTPVNAVEKARREATGEGVQAVAIFARYERNKPGFDLGKPKDIETFSPYKEAPERPWEMVYWVSATGLERPMGAWREWTWAQECAATANAKLRQEQS